MPVISKRKNRVRIRFYKQVFPMAVFVVLVLYVVSFFTPLMWTFITSFKSKDDFILNPFLLPESWRFDNYSTVFRELYVPVTTDKGVLQYFAPQLLFNSLLYAVVSTIITLLSHMFAAYASAKYSKYLVPRLLYHIVIVTMILPIVGNLPSTLQLMRAIGFYDNLFGLWVMKASFLGLNYMILYATFKGISWEYAEAAFIDGAGHGRVLFTVMVPLAKTTLTAIGLLTFIGLWNDWQVNIIYLPSFPMIAYALYNFQHNTINAIAAVPFQLAACTIVMLPILILFLIFRKKLMGNIAIGGIKG